MVLLAGNIRLHCERISHRQIYTVAMGNFLGHILAEAVSMIERKTSQK